MVQWFNCFVPYRLNLRCCLVLCHLTLKRHKEGRKSPRYVRNIKEVRGALWVTGKRALSDPANQVSSDYKEAFYCHNTHRLSLFSTLQVFWEYTVSFVYAGECEHNALRLAAKACQHYVWCLRNKTSAKSSFSVSCSFHTRLIKNNLHRVKTQLDFKSLPKLISFLSVKLAELEIMSSLPHIHSTGEQEEMRVVCICARVLVSSDAN